ncbi:ribokinase [Cohnella xylanilytica]|uniref:Ribokinase n=1 Tax=Cohnella xylanilytica TaxID=557555 RepID=A0A841UC98_9BACL|nr:ribokinase [Cohnella xylanilytica]MBB6695823.1 ribokinase [Cohnella xylanilytica]GIO11185.1 ribokinase [Cohnella xylanilytica]
MSRIVAVGSINMDLVNHVAEFPLPGETIHGRGTEYLPGGKGANQAVAASLAGGNVAMIGAVGEDSFAEPLLASLRDRGVDVSGVLRKPGTSGLAFITVSDAGENQIILSEGSNGRLRPEDLPAEKLAEADAVILQNEIPWETNLRAMEICRTGRAKVVYNPAPVKPIPQEAYPLIDLLVVNETEAEGLSGVPVDGLEGAEKAAKELLGRGAGSVLVTLGAQGSYYLGPDGGGIRTPAFPVRPVDTTAAGDTFIGALVTAEAGGMKTADALRFASAASAIAVTRKGAQASIPTRDEIERMVAPSNG